MRFQQGDEVDDGAAASSQSVVPPAAGTDTATAQPRGIDSGAVPGLARARKAFALAIVAGYLAGAVALTWQLWLDPAGRAQVVPGNGISRDVALFAWFMRYAATAVAHGQLPGLVTTALNAPQGINLMWNTSFLLPGVVLAPVTLLAGPHVSLTIMLTLGFAGSAAAMFLVLRRWGAGLAAAALGGALYGFSPAMRMMAVGHYHLVFAALPPLIIDALLRIVTGRPHPLRTGLWLGLLVAAQLFTGEELLVITILTAAVILLLLVVTRPRAVPGRLKAAAAGLAVAAVVTAATCGYALWVQLRGPLASSGSPWKPSHFWNPPGEFVTAPNGMLWHSQHEASVLAAHPVAASEYAAYLGWPLLLVLLLAAVWLWRDPRVRLMALTFAILELFSFGTNTVAFPGFSYPAWLLPWHWLGQLPLLNNLLPNRFSLLADGAAAAVLAFALERALHAAPGRRRWWRPAVAAVALLAVLPLIPVPLQAGPVSRVPADWQAALASLRLPPMARVLAIPVVPAQTMEWQAQTGLPISIIGGYCIAPSPSGKAERCATVRKSTAAYLSSRRRPRLPAGPSAGIRADLRYWRPAAIVAVAGRGSWRARFLGRLFGRPAGRVGDVVVWRMTAASRAGG